MPKTYRDFRPKDYIYVSDVDDDFDDSVFMTAPAYSANEASSIHKVQCGVSRFS